MYMYVSRQKEREKERKTGGRHIQITTATYTCMCQFAFWGRPPRGPVGGGARRGAPWGGARRGAPWGWGGARRGAWGEAPKDFTKPRQTIQSPNRLYKAQKHYTRPRKDYTKT